MTDIEIKDILRRIKDGDGKAFEELTEKYKSVIESSALRSARSMEKSGLAASEEVMEDLKQEARLALYKAALRYDADGVGKKVTFGLFAKICVRNALISEIRRAAAKRRRHIKASEAEAKMKSAVTGDHTENSAISRLELQEIIKRSERVLSKYEMRILELYFQGKSASEISEIVKKPPKSVSNALYRIKVKLKGLSE